MIQTHLRNINQNNFKLIMESAHKKGIELSTSEKV
jgi:hypothetical protein